MEMGNRVGFLLLITLKKEQQLWAQGPWERDRGASFEELQGWQVQKGEPAPGDLKGGNPGERVEFAERSQLGPWGSCLPSHPLKHSFVRSGSRHSWVPGTVLRMG